MGIFFYIILDDSLHLDRILILALCGIAMLLLGKDHVYNLLLVQLLGWKMFVLCFMCIIRVKVYMWLLCMEM